MANAIEEYRKQKSKQGIEGAKAISPIEEYRKLNTSQVQSQPSAIDLYRQQTGVTPRVSNAKLDTKDGLYQLAVNAGLKDRADEILRKQQGEKTKQIYSGGFISDIFDTLSALQYGVTGLLKGKSFSEGMATRQSFSDKDALGDNGLPGVIAGLALDIAVDPLTYIAPWTIAGKIPGVTKAAKATKAGLFGKMATKVIDAGTEAERTYQALEGGTKAGRYLADKFVWMFGKDPVFRETIERGTKNIAMGTQNVVDLTKSVAKITPETAAKILIKDEKGRFLRAPLDTLSGVLTKDELAPVAELYKVVDDLGQQAVDLGLLSRETYQENLGEYIKNAYEEYETAKRGGLFPSSKVGIRNIFKRRKELKAGETVAKFGLTQVDNPSYLLFKSAFDLTRDVENAKILKAVGENFGVKAAQEGFELMPVSKRLGALAGKYIPKDMAEYLKPIMTPDPQTIGKQLVAGFKFAKVIMNPGTHARNIISNSLLNWWKLGLGPWRQDIYVTALKQALGGGKWVDEAKTVGYNLDTFASAEMKNLLDSPEANAWGKSKSIWNKTKETLGNIYQQEENVAKLAAFIFHRKKGVGIEEAWKAAESATFNYAQVTPFVRKLREGLFGFPFITFTVKSTPVAVETALKHPRRISALGKIKTAIESQSDPVELAKERASEPPWVKEGFYVKLPIKDKEGRSAYFDLTYILPFGDIVSGNILERSTKRETGSPESLPETALGKAPFFNFIKEISRNQDFYGNKLWKESDPVEKQLADFFRHLVKSYAPPLAGDLMPGGYNERGERQTRGFLGADKASSENQKRTLMEELLRSVGAKIQPVDADIQETLQDWNTKKALTALLLENFEDTGLKEFNRLYIPK